MPLLKKIFIDDDGALKGLCESGDTIRLGIPMARSMVFKSRASDDCRDISGRRATEILGAYGELNSLARLDDRVFYDISENPSGQSLYSIIFAFNVFEKM
jgi:hypothetical protein